jgi:hypothetical protein
MRTVSRRGRRGRSARTLWRSRNEHGRFVDRSAVVHLRVGDLSALASDDVARVLAAEDEYGGQAAAIEAEPALAEAAATVQRVRAALAAAALGVELRGDGRPFSDDLVANAARVLRLIVECDAHTR